MSASASETDATATATATASATAIARPTALDAMPAGSRRAFLGGVAAASALAMPALAPAAPPPPTRCSSPPPAGAPRGGREALARRRGMGLHVHDPDDLPSASRLHYRFLRLWDTGTAWTHLEPRPGEFDFSRLDRFVDAAGRAGAEVILTLGQTPAWAARDPKSPSPYGAGASSPPRELSDWKRYVRTLANRYRGRIRYWELWNEVNAPQFFAGTPADLVPLAETAARILRETEGGLLLSPSIQGGAFKEFRTLAASEVLSHCDLVSYHFYAPFDGPEVSFQRMQEVRRLLDASGHANLPIWNTEVGWLVAPPDRPNAATPAWAKGWRSLGPVGAAGYLVRLAVLQRAADVDMLGWYAWDNAMMGMGGARRGAGFPHLVAAFNFCADVVMEAESVCVTQDGEGWTADIHARDQAWRLAWGSPAALQGARAGGWVETPLPGLAPPEARLEASPEARPGASAARPDPDLPLLFRRH